MRDDFLQQPFGNRDAADGRRLEFEASNAVAGPDHAGGRDGHAAGQVAAQIEKARAVAGLPHRVEIHDGSARDPSVPGCGHRPVDDPRRQRAA